MRRVQKKRSGEKAAMWLAGEDDDSIAPIVWAAGTEYRSRPVRRHTLQPESIALLEEFHAWKLFGAGNVYDLPARLVEAIFMLENELRAESNDGQK